MHPPVILCPKVGTRHTEIYPGGGWGCGSACRISFFRSPGDSGVPGDGPTDFGVNGSSPRFYTPSPWVNWGFVAVIIPI